MTHWRVPSLKNTVRGKIYYTNNADRQADMSKMMPEPVIEIDDNFLDVLFEKHGQVKMLTDRLNFINEQRLIVAQTSYASRIYVVLEVPTKLHMKKGNKRLGHKRKNTISDEHKKNRNRAVSRFRFFVANAKKGK